MPIPSKPVKGSLGLKQEHIILGFTAIPPKLVKGSLAPKQAWMPSNFFTNTLRNLPVSTLGIYRNPAKTNQRIPRPLRIFLRPPHPFPKPSINPKLDQKKEPHHTMVIWKWQGKVETIVTRGKTHVNDSKRNK